MAQDHAQVAVLTAQPLAVVFVAPAERASLAEFTPDSTEILFVSGVAHAKSRGLVFRGADTNLERWRIRDGRLVESVAIPWQRCSTAKISPDGRALACNDAGGTLQLIDIASGRPIFEKKEFARFIVSLGPDGREFPATLSGDVGFARWDFSPDGRWFVGFPALAEGGTVAWDLREGVAVKLKGGLKALKQGYHFAFIASNRVLISKAIVGRLTVQATVVAFPSGNIESAPRIPPGQLFRAADPAFILIRPFGQYVRDDDAKCTRAAAVEIGTGQAIISDTPALDVFGRYYVAEPNVGEVGLYERGKGLRETISVEMR